MVAWLYDSLYGYLAGLMAIWLIAWLWVCCMVIWIDIRLVVGMVAWLYASLDGYLASLTTIWLTIWLVIGPVIDKVARRWLITDCMFIWLFVWLWVVIGLFEWLFACLTSNRCSNKHGLIVWLFDSLHVM